MLMYDLQESIAYVYKFLSKNYILIEELNIYINKKYIRSLIQLYKGKAIPDSHFEVLRMLNLVNERGITQLGIYLIKYFNFKRL